MLIDKFKTCKDCPDRCVSPNCHMTCEGYLHRVKAGEAIRKEKAIEREVLSERDETYHTLFNNTVRSAAFKRRARYRNPENLERARRA